MDPSVRTGRMGRQAGRLRSFWLPIGLAAIPAAMFLLIGSGVRQPDGVPYRCPSAVRQLIGGSGLEIRPTLVAGEVRLYDPRDTRLVNAPGVWTRCRAKNTQAALIAGLALSAGLAFAMVRAAGRPGSRPGLATRRPAG